MKWLKLWPILFFALTVIGAVVSFWFSTKTHMEDPDIHFIHAVGETKQDFAKVHYVQEQEAVQMQELDRKLEVQSLKQELQTRKILEEYRGNFEVFKRKTRELEEKVE